MSEWVATLRQLRYPRELRIESSGPAGKLPDFDEAIRQLEEMGGGTDDSEPPEALDPRFAAKLGTLTWRFQQKMAELPEDNAAVWLDRRIQMLEVLLRGQGIEVRDFTGQDFDPNEIWDEPIGTEGTKAHAVIVAMQEPRIVLHGVVIQRGKPIVGARSAQTDREAPR